MSAKKIFLMFFLCCCASNYIFSEEILADVELRPAKKMSFLFAPVVVPDLLSAKAYFEYKLSRKFNIVVPIEAKWMDYVLPLKFLGLDKKVQDFYSTSDLKPLWDINFSQLKISTGLGAKWFPFSESMTNNFFVKASTLIGFENFYSYLQEKSQQSAVITLNLGLGYTWIKLNGFSFGFESGFDYILHTNPIKNIPTVMIAGFSPYLQGTIGLTR